MDNIFDQVAGEHAWPPEPDTDDGKRSYTISEMMALFDVTARTLRFYEQEGLLEPTRDGQHRLYPLRERTRLKLILRGKRLGFSLVEIADILGMYESAPGESGQLEHLIERIAERRAQLEQKLSDITAVLSDLDRVEAGCRLRLGELSVSGSKRGRQT